MTDRERDEQEEQHCHFPDACNPGSIQSNPLSTEPGSTRVVVRTRLKSVVCLEGENSMHLMLNKACSRIGVYSPSYSTLSSAFFYVV